MELCKSYLISNQPQVGSLVTSLTNKRGRLIYEHLDIKVFLYLANFDHSMVSGQ